MRKLFHLCLVALALFVTAHTIASTITGVITQLQFLAEMGICAMCSLLFLVTVKPRIS